VGESEEISKVLFELSSNRRANILFEIGKDALKMLQIAKVLDMTVTETFRHLQRLTDAKLIEKKVDGTYAVTSLGNLATGFLGGFNFILKNGDYFLEHDVSCLPYEFVNRLGELSNGEFCAEAMANFNRVRKMVYEANEYIWGMGEQIESSHLQPAIDKVSKGLNFRTILQKGYAKPAFSPGIELLKEKRVLERIPVSLLVTEKEAVVNLRRRNGEMDYLGFFGTDEKFRKWTRDLFMNCWEKAERLYPSVQSK
jgi:predicted transcriptional regulator